MSVVAGISEAFKGRSQGAINSLRKSLFGANNEKLDFVMDSFYKLSSSQRTGVLCGIVAAICLFVLAAFGLYFSQVHRLSDDFSNSIAGLHELKALRGQYEQESKNYDKLVETIDKKTKGQALKPFFEQIAQTLGVTLEGLSDTKVALAADNPLVEKVKEARAEVRLPNISIPRLLNFLVEVEKSNRFLRVQDLKVQARYGTKLLFDGQVKVRGYVVEN